MPANPVLSGADGVSRCATRSNSAAAMLCDVGENEESMAEVRLELGYDVGEVM
jgi:hypothetical protein